MDMYETHLFTLHKVCPCKIGSESIQKTFNLFTELKNISTFVNEMENQRIIGKRIWYDKEENTIFIKKMYASESGGGCPKNNNMIGERCHCDHYNSSKEFKPKYYCKCGAEFYRPMFAPLFGDNVLIEPYKTVLSGDDECIIAIRIDKKEAK
jgi:hypothetical protein